MREIVTAQIIEDSQQLELTPSAEREIGLVSVDSL